MSHTKDCERLYYQDRKQVVDSYNFLIIEAVESHLEPGVIISYYMRAQRPFLPFLLMKDTDPRDRLPKADQVTYKQLYYNMAMEALQASVNYYTDAAPGIYPSIEASEYKAYLNRWVTGKPEDLNRFKMLHSEMFDFLTNETFATESDFDKQLRAQMEGLSLTSERLLFLPPGDYYFDPNGALGIQLAALLDPDTDFNSIKALEINSIG